MHDGFVAVGAGLLVVCAGQSRYALSLWRWVMLWWRSVMVG